MELLYEAHEQEGLLLNANESARNADPVILEELMTRIQQAALNRYPDDTAKELIEAFASLHHLDPNGVFVGNGSDAMLQLMIHAFCRDGKKLVMLDPDFGMYRFYSTCMQSNHADFPTAWDGSFDLDAFVQFAKEQNAGLVLLSNPNNPTGHLLSKEQMLDLAQKLDPIILAADEAYMDFASQSVLEHAQKVPNLIVTRTLSKAWGLVGIRVGFLVSSLEIAKLLAPYRIVYSVSTLDQLAAIAALHHAEVAAANMEEIQSEKERIASRLTKMPWIEWAPIHVNFYSIKTDDMEELEQAFADNQIAIRDNPDHSRIRITIGTPEQNDQVLEILEAWNPENWND